jgi:16S rRNA (uracil1498-N3)-methyltransferase
MRITRIYLYSTVIQENEVITLPQETSHYISRVLRAKVGDILHLFDGKRPQEYVAEIIEISKKSVLAKIKSVHKVNNESPLSIHIGQALVKGDKLDTIIQKSTELGVKALTPLITERCDYKLSKDRLDKKILHWQKIAISAAEQSGRVFPMQINEPCTLQVWFDQKHQHCLILDPYSKTCLQDLDLQNPTQISITIGPEGGFTAQEIKMIQHKNTTAIQLGPRILRTETAPIAMTAILQSLYGDF